MCSGDRSLVNKYHCNDFTAVCVSVCVWGGDSSAQHCKYRQQTEVVAGRPGGYFRCSHSHPIQYLRFGQNRTAPAQNGQRTRQFLPDSVVNLLQGTAACIRQISRAAASASRAPLFLHTKLRLVFGIRRAYVREMSAITSWYLRLPSFVFACNPGRGFETPTTLDSSDSPPPKPWARGTASVIVPRYHTPWSSPGASFVSPPTGETINVARPRDCGLPTFFLSWPFR